jgi:hypothetical protein
LPNRIDRGDCKALLTASPRLPNQQSDHALIPRKSLRIRQRDSRSGQQRLIGSPAPMSQSTEAFEVHEMGNLSYT